MERARQRMRKLEGRIRALASEVGRRGVFKAVAAYAVVAWGASLAASELLPTFGAPPWVTRAFIVSAALGLPIVAVLAWLYELTAGGLVADAGGSVATQPRAGDATVVFGSVPSLHVRWVDALGPHERTFIDSFAIGRDAPCELRLDDPCISRRHAEVRYEQGHWWLVDLGSRNGTRLDGRRVQREPLPARCSVRLYDAGPELRLETDGGSATMTVASVPDHAPPRGGR
jgi:hypothetical protein